MLPTYEATYHDGIVDLKEHPQGISEARVVVTFVDVRISNPVDTPVSGKQKAIQRLQILLSDVPETRSLAQELIDERRAEALHE
jgi:hypothetical protein